MAERSFKKEVAKLRLGAGRGIPRRRHPRGHQGAAAVRRVLRLRLSGRADLAPGRRARRRQRHAAASSASASRRAPTRRRPPRRSPPRSTIRCAAPPPSSPRSAPMSPPTRSPTSPRAASPGGALIIVGEDYGEGSSIMQERSHAFAMKSQMWLLDPRPNLPSIVQAVEKGFELSEASNTPVMLELRIRACHVYGSFTARDNARPAFTLQGRARKSQARRQPHRAAARELPAREGEDREALAGRRALHRASTSSTNSSTATPATSASSCRAACTTPRCARSRCSGSPMCSATAAFRSTCSTSPIR